MGGLLSFCRDERLASCEVLAVVAPKLLLVGSSRKFPWKISFLDS